MTDGTTRLADILVQHTAAMRDIEGPNEHSAQAARSPRRVLLPADRQRGAKPPTIAESAEPTGGF
jgi:hypothetical protein